MRCFVPVILVDHPGHFEKFISNISLDESRAARIEAALGNLRRFSQTDVLAKIVAADLYTQGSHSYGTVTRPLIETTEYDVDVILPINANLRPENKRDPDSILEYVKSRFDTYPAYAGKVTRRRVCLRINYSGDFHLDVVPAHQPNGRGTGLYVPNRESGKWEPSHPEQYSAWVKALNGGKSQFRFAPTVKILKRWRDSAFGVGKGPSSIILTSLAGFYNPGVVPANEMPFASEYERSPSVSSYLYDTVNTMHHRLLGFNGGIRIANPVFQEENLAQRWSAEGFQLFRTRLETLAKRVTRAYHQADRERSIAWWQEAFPDGFPSRP